MIKNLNFLLFSVFIISGGYAQNSFQNKVNKQVNDFKYSVNNELTDFNHSVSEIIALFVNAENELYARNQINEAESLKQIEPIKLETVLNSEIKPDIDTALFFFKKTKNEEQDKNISFEPSVEQNKDNSFDEPISTPCYYPLKKDSEFLVTSPFSKSRQHPVLKIWRAHRGVDYGVPEGTPVYATADGVVEINKYSKSAGYYLKLNHGTCSTRYMHFRKKSHLSVGEKVKVGDCIGYVGTTGISTNPHLHYEVIHNASSEYKNPVDFTTKYF